MNSRGWREIAQGPHGIPGRVGLVIRRHPLGLFLRGWLIECIRSSGVAATAFGPILASKLAAHSRTSGLGHLRRSRSKGTSEGSAVPPSSGKASERGETAVVPVPAVRKDRAPAGSAPPCNWHMRMLLSGGPPPQDRSRRPPTRAGCHWKERTKISQYPCRQAPDLRGLITEGCRRGRRAAPCPRPCRSDRAPDRTASQTGCYLEGERVVNDNEGTEDFALDCFIVSSRGRSMHGMSC